jgi:hypothetical protein
MRACPEQMRLSAVLAIASITGTTKSASADQQITPVEIWCVGDDGLTLRLRDTVEHVLRSSSSFRLSSEKKPGTLLVTIPTNVGWKQLGKKTRVLYEVTFSTVDGKNLGEKKGSCWSDHLEGCAASILQSAKSAARSIH